MQPTPHFSLPPFLARIAWRDWLPSRGNVVFTLAVVFALFWAQAAHALPWMEPAAAATSTGSWPYQGRLADTSGTPITATIPMIFRLYSAASGGVPLWEEQWTGSNSVQVSDGLFNVMLGSLTVIPQSIVTANTNLWLGITAGSDDEMAPRVQLGSVPFAAQALTVPDGSIGAAKIANGAITNSKLAPNALPLIQLGDIGGDYTTPGWNLHLGTGSRDFRKTVTFTTPYAQIPQVIVSLKTIDDSYLTGTRIGVRVENVTITGFVVVIYTYADSIVYGATGSWIAIGTH